jgi:hypothetical protein
MSDHSLPVTNHGLQTTSNQLYKAMTAYKRTSNRIKAALYSNNAHNLLVDLRKFPSRIMIPFLAWTCLPRPAA